MATRNDVTGDLIRSKTTNQNAYADGWDRIFGNKQKTVDVLDLQIDDDGTLRELLLGMMLRLWDDPEGFSGKRALNGDSGWQCRVYHIMAEQKLISGEWNEEWEEWENVDYITADKLINEALTKLFKKD